MKEDDLRNRRTRANLRAVLAELLKAKEFEKITVKELCMKASISRITFYNHYGDKYELLEDVFRELDTKIKCEYARRCEKENPEDDPIKGYQILADCVIDLNFSMQDVLKHVSFQQNNILLNPYYHTVADNVTLIMHRYEDRIRPNYPIKMLSSFLVLGLYGFLHGMAFKTREELEAYREAADEMLKNLLMSDLFTRVPR